MSSGMQCWELDDGDERAAANPYTFFKSPAESIALVTTGEFVKLIFRSIAGDASSGSVERMWVKVTAPPMEGKFLGELANKPKGIEGLLLGDRISFASRHIINTQHDPQDNLVERYSPTCIVNRRILDGRQKVGRLYRDKPSAPRDSGWVILTGIESDGEIEDPETFTTVSLGAVLSIDDSIKGLLDSQPESDFERDLTLGTFARIPWLKPEER